MLCFIAAAYNIKDLADDGIISGSDSVEDPLDAFQLLFIAGGDSVKCFIVVLQGTAALAGKRNNTVSICNSPLERV